MYYLFFDKVQSRLPLVFRRLSCIQRHPSCLQRPTNLPRVNASIGLVVNWIFLSKCTDALRTRMRRTGTCLVPLLEVIRAAPPNSPPNGTCQWRPRPKSTNRSSRSNSASSYGEFFGRQHPLTCSAPLRQPGEGWNFFFWGGVNDYFFCSCFFSSTYRY